uniref:Transposase n=1 Tax=Candidatus Kentrum eta TaxID=2126337 RepID=A0A450VN26_9GAMM|nr:MAG: Transposase [Candidatus Kentron sp. H]VFK06209.1 MAG: Transposase [Candidatus Kentron sp. H]
MPFTQIFLHSLIANLPPCVIGMEACGSAHHWYRVFTQMNHTVHLMAAQFVKPFVKSNKNDATDAEAICEAVHRPSFSHHCLWLSGNGENHSSHCLSILRHCRECFRNGTRSFRDG